MSLLSRIKIKNFKCFREVIDVPLNQGSYFIGINNSGKTAILNAVHFFFDNSLYQDEAFLNRTEYLAKKSDYNKSEITIFFNLSALKNRALKARLIKLFGSEKIHIKKNIIYTPLSGKMSFTYEAVNSIDYSFEDLDKDIQKLLMSIKISYIHPQEGRELLKKAQDKLRQRLLSNWGLGKTLSRDLKELQTKWDELRKSARNQLSASLTTNIQKMWPGSQASIDLPKNIKDVVAISNISFKGDIALPEIELPSQGTGAQSVILYLAHYLLDSDRSLHQGEYHPVWLLEEPESFLHADLITKFAQELNSQDWLENIQMFTSTHSPIILALSRLGGGNIIWNQIENTKVKRSKKVTDWTDDEIREIGGVMGDPNFYIYFSAVSSGKLIFIEDSRTETADAFRNAGVDVAKGLRGVPEIARYVDVFINLNELLDKEAYFIVDADKGIKDISRFLDTTLTNKERNGFIRHNVKNGKKIFIITLPDGFNVEDMFDEFDNYLEQCIAKIWDTSSWSFQKNIPCDLVRISAEAKGKIVNNLSDAKRVIRNHQDTKDGFWQKIINERLAMSATKIGSIKYLLV